MRVLVVDDSPLVRRILKDFLTEAGHDVSEAADFTEAKVVYAVFQPQIIIKDLYMKGCNVIDSIRFFRDLDSQVKIVLCSTRSLQSQSLIIEGLKAGANEFLLKPLEQKRVLELVEKLIAS
jgi:two-component system chemotaxis response regulator CheY